MRSRVEVGLRAVAWVALAGTAWLAWRGPAVSPVWRADGVPDVPELARWAMVPPGDTLRVTIEGLPDDTARARLAALAGAGLGVTWRDAGVPALAVAAEQDAATGRGIVRAVGGAAMVTDGAGSVGPVEGALVVPGMVLPVTAGARPGVELVPARKAIVLGRPSWEARWLARALEDLGWEVDAALRIAPGLATARPDLDTAHTSLVVVLDSVDADVARSVVRFVRAGGGVVLAPAALTSPVLATIAPGSVGDPVRPATVALPADRSGLTYRPLVRLAGDAVPLETDRVAARVEGEGRVVLVGDQETWRLALASDDGQRVHAAFWARVADAARARPLGERIAGDPAPRAALVAAFGPPVEAPAPWAPGLPWEAISFGVVLAALLAEWASRRVRGRA